MDKGTSHPPTSLPDTPAGPAAPGAAPVVPVAGATPALPTQPTAMPMLPPPMYPFGFNPYMGWQMPSLQGYSQGALPPGYPAPSFPLSSLPPALASAPAPAPVLAQAPVEVQDQCTCPSPPPRSKISIADFCARYDLEEGDEAGLDRLGFRVGDDLCTLTKDDWLGMGIKPLVMRRIFEAIRTYKQDILSD